MPEEKTLRECAMEGKPLDGCLVIDAHSHLGGRGTFSIPVHEPEGVVAVMDRVGIDVLCASHLLSLTGDCRRGNDLLSDAVRRFPGRFIGYAVIDPNRPEDIVPELDRCTRELGMKGIKVHTSFQDYPIDGPGFWRAYEYAQAHGGLPVLGHGFSRASAMERIARAFPQVPFIVAHTGGGYQGRSSNETVGLAAALDNVYLDLVSSTVHFGALEVLVREIGARKILYGSDMCYNQATHQIGRVLFADIPEGDKELILGLNAAKLFGVERPGGSG